MYKDTHLESILLSHNMCKFTNVEIPDTFAGLTFLISKTKVGNIVIRFVSPCGNSAIIVEQTGKRNFQERLTYTREEFYTKQIEKDCFAAVALYVKMKYKANLNRIS